MGVFSPHEKDYLGIVDRVGSLPNFILDIGVYFRKKVTQSGFGSHGFPSPCVDCPLRMQI